MLNVYVCLLYALTGWGAAGKFALTFIFTKSEAIYYLTEHVIIVVC